MNYVKVPQYISNLEDMMYPFHTTKSQEKDNEIGIFYTTWKFLPNKRKYFYFLLISELISSIGMLGLLLESKILIIFSPLVALCINLLREKYFIKQGYQARKKFRTLVYDYFDNLSYAERKSYENMTDFDNMVESSSRVICNIMDWGIPTITKMIITSISCLIVFYSKGYLYLMPLSVVIYYAFYKFYMKEQRKKLLNIRTDKRESNKKIIPLKRWISHLFQNRKRSVDDLLINSNKIDDLDERFVLEWVKVSQMMNLISILISSIGLYFVNDFVTLLIIKVVFDNFTNIVSMISNFTNGLSNNMKDFDKFLTWYKESNGRETPYVNSIVKFPLCINQVKIKYENFSLKAEELQIDSNDKILLKGQTGAGKTQLVNSIQGLVHGSTMSEISDPRTIQHAFEYMNQQTRESIPSTGLSLRDLLEGETDNTLIGDLLKVVMLDMKFSDKSSYDIKISGLSGGEKMRLSLVFTLLETIKKNKQLLILDEPEQGLDESTRRQVISNILNYLSIPIICIYHGSSLDLLKMPFNKIWLFDHKNTHTQVSQYNFINYKKKLIDEINNDIYFV